MDHPRRALARPGTLALAAILALLPALTSAHAAGGKRDALAIAGDQEEDLSKRMNALRDSIESMKKGDIDPPAWREGMKKIAWKASNPAKIRLPAIEALVEQDEADSRHMLALMIPREPQRPVVDLAADLATKGKWTEMTPALVRSWSRKLINPPDEERSERLALVALHPEKPLPDVVFEVFATPVPEDASDQSLAKRARADAWSLLCRLDKDHSRTRALLAGSPDVASSTDPTMLALRESALELKSVPATGEQLDWLLELRKPERSKFFGAAKDAIAGLNDEQIAGLELRHASGVIWAAANSPEWLRMNRAALLAEVSKRIDPQKHHRRTADTAEGAPMPKESIAAFDAKLVWGDALLLLISTEALRDSGAVAELFTEVEADRNDKTTEYGGILDGASSGSGFVAMLYPPRGAQRPGDGKFVASPEMLDAGTTALFHYHFHARTMDEREFAGPSEGDREYAERFGRSCLVFASINATTLAVDYYQPNGAVIDLGEIARASDAGKSGSPGKR